MTKEICIIAANCQGAYFKAMLSASPGFRERYEIHYFVNYNHETVPPELLKRCKLLIYQPLGPKWGDLSSYKLIHGAAKDCRTISINYLTFPVYWPFMVHDSRNQPDASHPFGQFPYGDSLIVDMLSAGMKPDEVLRNYLEGPYVEAKTSPDRILESYIAKQRDLEDRRDQKVLDFILANYRTTRLFETYNHPSRPLCIHQGNDVLQRLDFPPLLHEQLPVLPYLQDNQQPIHPVVAKSLGLEFECSASTIYNVWKKPLTFTQYTEAYVRWDVSAIGSQPTPAAKVPVVPAPAAPVPPPASTPLPAPGPSPSPAPKPTAKQAPNPTMQHEQLIFLHIPKTAGSSLNKMLSEAYGVQQPDGKFTHYNSTLTLIKDPKRRERPVILGHVHHDVIDVLSPNRKVITFLRDPIERTISAFEFMKSHPEVWLGKLAQGTISEFLSHPNVSKMIRNVQVRLIGSKHNFKKLYADLVAGRLTRDRYFARIQEMSLDPVDRETLETAKERIAKLDFVGFTDTFDEDARALFEKLGKPCPEQIARVNQTPERFKKRDKYSAEELELVSSLNSLDMELYQFAKQLKSRAVAGSPAV
jgi:Polysaccharide biosynthesis enzyme WcbI/Sulfotransferase family